MRLLNLPLYLLCVTLATQTLTASGQLDDEDGSKKVIRTPLHRFTFDLTDHAKVIDFITHDQWPIPDFGKNIFRQSGRTLTSDAVKESQALFFNGKSFLSLGPLSGWDSKINRTLAFYVKKAPERQPNAVLCHQEGSDGEAIHIAFGPKGDGTDLFVKIGSAEWEGTLSEPIRDNTWTHLIFTTGHGGLKVFVDTHPQPPGSKGKYIEPTDDLLIGGAPKKNGFKGGIDDVRFWNLTHQGDYFVMPRYRIELPNPEKVERKGDQWYRGKALALRLTWNRYMYSTLPSRKKAGTEFNAEEIADLAVASGACGVLMKMRAPNGFAVFPSQYLPAKMQQDRDYVGELVVALKNRGLWFAPNLSQENIDAMARQHGMTKAESYYTLVKEILDRYDVNMYQFRFDGFWGQDETYDPKDYNHQKVWELFRERHPEMLINFNRFTGHGAEDMADIETSRPADQVHYWEQEDFHEILPCRDWDWAVEVETPLGDDWASGGPLTALPSHFLLNKVSALSAMGITTVIGFGPDNRGRLTDAQRQTLREIGKWLVPRKPWLDNVRPFHDARVEGYAGLWYVNSVNNGIAVNLLRGSRIPCELPQVLEVSGVGNVSKATLVPQGIELPIRKTATGCKIALPGVEQDRYNTIIFLEF